MDIVSFLSGKKTYICAVLVGIVTVASYLGWIDQGTSNILYGLLGAGSIAAMRAAITKTNE